MAQPKPDVGAQLEPYRANRPAPRGRHPEQDRGEHLVANTENRPRAKLTVRPERVKARQGQH